MSDPRRRHSYALMLVGLSMGVVVGAFATIVVDRSHLIMFAAVLIGVVTLVAPPFRQVYPDD